MLLIGLLLACLMPAAVLPNSVSGKSNAREIAKLGAMVGRWKATTSTFQTKFSHAGRSSGTITCRWSTDRRFVIADLVVGTGQADNHQLKVYGWDPHLEQFYSYAFFATGGPPFVGHPDIRGNVWISRGEFRNGDSTVRTRTTYTFVSRNLVVIETQYSEDGIHWITIMKGKNVRVQ